MNLREQIEANIVEKVSIKIHLGLKEDVDKMVDEAKAIEQQRLQFIKQLRSDMKNVKGLVDDAKQFAKNGASRADSAPYDKAAESLNKKIDTAAGQLQDQANELGLDITKSPIYKSLSRAANEINSIASGDDEELYDIQETFEYAFAELNKLKV